MKKPNEKRKRGGQPGNKNAACPHKRDGYKGNKNAFKSGLYASIKYVDMSAEERLLLDMVMDQDTRELQRGLVAELEVMECRMFRQIGSVMTGLDSQQRLRSESILSSFEQIRQRGILSLYQMDMHEQRLQIARDRVGIMQARLEMGTKAPGTKPAQQQPHPSLLEMLRS